MNAPQEKANIGRLFDRIAGSYDALNHLFSMNIDKLWRRRLVRTMQPAQNVLDVAIGTGDLSLEMVRQHKAACITGIDLSEGMMQIGREKAAKRGITNIRFVQASALEMPYEDNLFDAVTCSFGTRNFSHLHKGLEEMHRVLRPGGELLILEFSYPENRLIAAIYDFYFSRIMPSVGGWFSKDKPAYTYLNHSVKQFIWGEQYCAALREVGFAKVSYKPLTFGIATLYTANKEK